MGRIVYGVIAIIACFVMAESLSCNKCSVGVFGFCLSSSQITCGTNTSVCFYGKASFPSISSTFGFNTLGCAEGTSCNSSTTSLLGVSVQTTVSCCSTANCNTIQSGAPINKMSLTAVIGAAIVASVWARIV